MISQHHSVDWSTRKVHPGGESPTLMHYPAHNFVYTPSTEPTHMSRPPCPMKINPIISDFSPYTYDHHCSLRSASWRHCMSWLIKPSFEVDEFPPSKTNTEVTWKMIFFPLKKNMSIALNKKHLSFSGFKTLRTKTSDFFGPSQHHLILWI